MFAPINVGVLYSFLALMLVLAAVCIFCALYGLVNYKANKGRFCIVVSLAIIGECFVMIGMP